MLGDSNYRLVEFLKKVRKSDAEYIDFWIERLTKSLPKTKETKDAIIESLKCDAREISNASSFYHIHLSLIKEIISSDDTNFWNCDYVRNFVEQFLNSISVDDSPPSVAVNALYLLYDELEKNDCPYDNEEVISKAFRLLNNTKTDKILKVIIFDYLDKVFSKKFTVQWAVAIAELLINMDRNSRIPSDRLLDNFDWCERLSQFLLYNPSLLSVEYTQKFFVNAKSETRSMRCIHCKLLAELVQQKKMDEKVLFDDGWNCICNRNMILLHLIALGRTELISVVFDSSDLRLSDLLELQRHSREDLPGYFERGLSILSGKSEVSSVHDFIVSVKDPTSDLLDSLYGALETHSLINSMTLDALLTKSNAWNEKIIPILATKSLQQLTLPSWEKRDTALDQLSVLIKHGYNKADLIQRISDSAINDEEPYVRREALKLLSQLVCSAKIAPVLVKILLSDTDSIPRIEAARTLLEKLPDTEKFCLEVIPKILYDEDVALHRVIIEICAKLISGGRNNNLRDLLMKFQEDEVDCYNELNEILYGNSSSRSSSKIPENTNELEYIFRTLTQMMMMYEGGECDKDCYDL